MVSSITRPPFRVASALPFDKISRSSEATYFYETKLRELEQKFESNAAELHEEYLEVISQIPRIAGGIIISCCRGLDMPPYLLRPGFPKSDKF